MGYTTERIGGAGKALSGSDVGVSERQEEFKELEEQRAKEALELVQKSSICLSSGKAKGKSDNFLQRLGGSRAIRHWTPFPLSVARLPCGKK